MVITHDISTPYRPNTNGAAKRAVRRVKEGTACALAQSGFDEFWWGFAMECDCYLRNIVDILMTNETAYHCRFSVGSECPIYPLDAGSNTSPYSKMMWHDVTNVVTS